MNTNQPQPQQQPQAQQQQQVEQTGMSRQFPENPSIELLNNRRIDQLVAKKEAERNAIAEGMASAENKGIQEGINRGREEGFIVGHNAGLEGGFNRGIQYSNNKYATGGLGNRLPQQENNSQADNSGSLVQEQQ